MNHSQLVVLILFLLFESLASSLLIGAEENSTLHESSAIDYDYEDDGSGGDGYLNVTVDNTTTKRRYALRLEELAVAFFPQEFLLKLLMNYLISVFGMQETTQGNSSDARNRTHDKDPLRVQALLNMDSAFLPCPKGRRRDKTGKCRKQFSG